MKKSGNELLQFLAGLAMLIAGLFILSQKVMVYSGFWGYGFTVGGMQLSNGLIMIPFIIGIVWLFASDGSLGAKLCTAAGVLIIILAIIMTTNIRLVHVTLFEWIVILVLIFGGAGLLAKLLFAGRGGTHAPTTRDPEIGRTSDRVDAIEEELKRIKKEEQK